VCVLHACVWCAFVCLRRAQFCGGHQCRVGSGMNQCEVCETKNKRAVELLLLWQGRSGLPFDLRGTRA
jgi:hypothetical protein